MAYASDILDKRITILYPTDSVTGDYGIVAGCYAVGRTIWANVVWSRGVKAMREGALDAYDTIMIRTRYATDLTRKCRIMTDDGTVYAIDSYHADQRDNVIQMTCHELTGAEPYVLCDDVFRTLDYHFEALVEDRILLRLYNQHTHVTSTLFSGIFGPGDYNDFPDLIEELGYTRVTTGDDGVRWRCNYYRLSAQNEEGESEGICTLTKEEVVEDMYILGKRVQKRTYVHYLDTTTGIAYRYNPDSDSFVRE